MNENNPYQASAEATTLAIKKPLGSLAIVAIAVVGLELAIIALQGAPLLRLAGAGAISILNLFAILLSTICVGLGGVLLAARKRSALYLFVVAALFGCLSWLQWHSALSVFIAVIPLALAIVTAHVHR